MSADAPLDPFAGDPDDPAAELSAFDDDTDEAPALTGPERAEIVDDLADLEGFQALLEPRGVRGLVVDCQGCEDQHFFAWDLLRGNLRHLLEAGTTRVHEPAHSPDPADYVSWDYARGYADAVLEAAED